MSPPANTPGRAVMRSSPTGTSPSSGRTSGIDRSRERSASCPRARTSESAGSSSNSPVGWGKPVVVELHPLDGQDSPVVADDGREPLEAHALVDGVGTSSALAGMRSRVRR